MSNSVQNKHRTAFISNEAANSQIGGERLLTLHLTVRWEKKVKVNCKLDYVQTEIIA
jgi:hypothetical protein